MKYFIIMFAFLLLIPVLKASDGDEEHAGDKGYIIYLKEMVFADRIKSGIPKDQICYLTYNKEIKEFLDIDLKCLERNEYKIRLFGMVVGIKALPLIIFSPNGCSIHYRMSRSPMPTSGKICARIINDFYRK